MNKNPQITQMNSDKKRKNHPRKSATSADSPLFDRVVSILEQARGNVVRAVNSNMVLAYWLIGREIVQEIQGGKGRAKYGEQVVENLSARLTERYGKGFSITNLWDFRQFYMAFPMRDRIPRPMGGESSEVVILRPSGGESPPVKKEYPPGTESPQGFSPKLSWSHYRALMRVENAEARNFYEREDVAGGGTNARWNVRFTLIITSGF